MKKDILPILGGDYGSGQIKIKLRANTMSEDYHKHCTK